MNELIAMGKLAGSETLMMSSREIAEVVEARHDNVKSTIERLAESGVINFPSRKEYSGHAGAGRPGTEYLLDKRSSVIVAAQFNPKVTAALYDRWAELEAKAESRTVLPDFNNPVIAARAWADAEEKRLLAETAAKQLEATVSVQAEQLIEAAPKVAFADKVTEAINCQTVAEVAKILGTGQNRLYRILRGKGLLMPDNVPYQRYVDAGWFKVVERQWTDESGCHLYSRTLVTGRGLQHIQRILDQEAA